MKLYSVIAKRRTVKFGPARAVCRRLQHRKISVGLFCGPCDMGEDFVAVQFLIPLLSISQAIPRQGIDDALVMNWKGLRTKWSLPILRSNLIIFLPKVRKRTRNPSQDTRATDVGFQSRHFQNTEQKQ
jgi:hypothetical protein